jgi:two-component system, NarL family, nitrate/nitrite response regulator NarL
VRISILSSSTLRADALAKALVAHMPVTTAIEAYASDVIMLFMQSTPDVVLVDAEALNLRDILSTLVSSGHDRIVVVGLHHARGVDLLGSIGVAGYVSENSRIDQLAEVIHTVSRGEHACCPVITAELLARPQHKRKRTAPCHGQELTRRELEVAQLIMAGLDNREIAQALFITVSTVKVHVHAILQKLGAKRRHEVTRAFSMSGERSRRGGSSAR